MTITDNAGNCTSTSGRVLIGSAEQVVVNGGAGQDDITLAPSAGIALAVSGGNGPDFFTVASIAPGATVAIDGGPGNEEFHVGDSGVSGRIGTALSIQGALTIDGGPGDNNRVFVRAGFGPPVPVPPAGAATVTVTPTNVGAAAGDNYFGPGGSLTYGGIQGLTLFVNDVSVAEGGAGRTVLRFDVRLTRPAAGPVRFNFATADLTARAGTDHVSARGSLMIPAGQVSRTVPVAVLGDTAVESGEPVRLVLSRITGVAVLDGVAIGTILNDDR